METLLLHMRPPQTFSRRLLNGELAIPFYLSLLNLSIHLYTNVTGGYGLFRDELYYLACADHLDLGYVDQPPLSIYILRLTTFLFGDSLFVVRLVPALCSALTIWITGLITLRMGGGRIALFVSCLFGFGFASFAMMGYYSMNSLEILSWAIAFYLLVRIVEGADNRYWIYLGITLGLGLLNKIGVLFLGAGLFAGLLVTENRKWFTTRWPYLAGIIAFGIFSPYILWNIQNDFAHLEFIRSASAEKYSTLNAADFLKGQLSINNPVAILIWLPGLCSFFLDERLRRYRILGVIYITALVVLVLNKTSKDVYLLPAYTPLWAAGGIFAESLWHRYKSARFAYMLIFVLWVVSTVVLLPLVKPVLPAPALVSYLKKLGIEIKNHENKAEAELHQFYADMFGWREKARDVAKVYNSLSESDRAKCAIYASNYGRCAAIDYYGREYGLPKSIGSHNAYWTWGPRDYTGEVVIILGEELDEHKDDFVSVEQAGTSDCDYCMPYEDNLKIFLCRGMKADLQDVWSTQKHYD